MIRAVIWDLGGTLIGPPPGGQDQKPLDQYEQIVLLPGAREAVQGLAGLNFSQAILSNTAVSDSDSVVRLMQRLGLASYFDTVLATVSELDGDRPGKPDRMVFEQMLGRIGISAKQAVMVGNSWDHDILGANRAGVHAIWLKNPDISTRSDWLSSVHLPPWVMPAVDLASVVATVADGLTRLQGQALPPLMKIVSGPSMTADIEGTLVVGVHGPGKVGAIIYSL